MGSSPGATHVTMGHCDCRRDRREAGDYNLRSLAFIEDWDHITEEQLPLFAVYFEVTRDADKAPRLTSPIINVSVIPRIE